nr:hypothetical protein GCM10020093_091360 [Planobispora longispora]
MTLAVRQLGVVGLTGPRDDVAGLARWLVGQAAALHSPRDLAIVVLSARGDGGARWNWARWLPHCARTAAKTAWRWSAPIRRPPPAGSASWPP